MAKELTKEEIEKSGEQAGERFVGTPDEFEFVGMENEIQVIEVKE